MNLKAFRASGAVLITVLLTACGVNGLTPSSRSAPLLVQVENLPAARPQSGLQDAAIVYEYVTEGGISRFSVIYTSPPKGRVGPIAAPRLWPTWLAGTYGAPPASPGASTHSRIRIHATGIPHADQ